MYYKKDNSTSLKGPLKAARLCILSLLVPGILVIAPLYVRYHVYSDHKYPLAVTDMRILDQKMSTFWCQVYYIYLIYIRLFFFFLIVCNESFSAAYSQY